MQSDDVTGQEQLGDPIWMYWKGEMPDYIRFCVETVKRHHPGRVVFATEQHLNAAFQRAMIPIEFREKLCVQHQADVLRAYLLRAYGGYWIDCDFLCLSPIDDLFDKHLYRFAAYKRLDVNEAVEVQAVDNDFLWATTEKISPFAIEFWERVVEVLQGNNFNVPSWASIGANILSAMAAKNPREFYEIPAKQVTFLRYMAKQFDAYAPEEIDDVIPPDCKGVMLIHSLSVSYLGHRTLEEIIRSKTVVGSLFRCAVRRLAT